MDRAAKTRGTMRGQVSALLLVCVAAACAGGDRGRVPTLSSRPPETPGLAAVAEDSDVPTGAIGFDGDLRLTEPLLQRQRRSDEGDLQPWVMPLAARRHPLLETRAHGSVSVGTVTGGYLVQAAEIEPDGKHHRVLALLEPRNTRFTTDEMKRLLLCAAARVAKTYPGQRLHVGNLARHDGGTVPWSVSHHNGRDADLAFYSRTPHGRPASPDHLYRFNAQLESVDAPVALRFDVAANWALAKALATCPGGDDIQFLFVAHWLKAPMLRWAHDADEPKAVIARVAALLHQPRNAMPHDDHLHVRIGCATDDRDEGCLDVARADPGALGRAARVEARLPRLRAALRDGGPEQRADALYLLGLYRDSASMDAMRSAVGDPDLTVRAAALDAWLDWQPTGSDVTLAQRVDKETDPRLLARALRGLADAGAWPALVQCLHDRRELQPGDDRPESPAVIVRALAADLIAGSGKPALAHHLVDLLADANPRVRRTARRGLESLLTRDAAVVVGLAGPGAFVTDVDAVAPEMERSAWLQVVASLGPDQPAEDLMVAGLQRAGFGVAAASRAALPELVRALATPGAVGVAAGRLIARSVGWRPPHGRGAYSDPDVFWPAWLAKRHLLPATAIPVQQGAGGSAWAADSD